MTKTKDIFKEGLKARGINMVLGWRVRFYAPDEDIDRIFDEVVKIAPLVHGKTDRNGIRAASGFEYYRPLAGTPTGAEENTRKRPNISEMAMTIPADEEQLIKIIDTIYETHSYYEPPIFVESVLRSETIGLDDSKNPNRWWNKKGDWKKG